MATPSACQCIGCIRTNCELCQECRNRDRCLLRRCQRFAYSSESEQVWHFKVQQLVGKHPPLSAPPPPRPSILPTNAEKDNHVVRKHQPVLLPKLISTIHEDVKTHRPQSYRSACGNCSKCHMGACQLCPHCRNQQGNKCPFVVCETVWYSSHYIASMERSARQALRLHPERLSRLYESLYGQDGFMTRQKVERQKEKETIYTNMFGAESGGDHRQIMLRSRFRRASPITPDQSKCDDDDDDDCIVVEVEPSSWKRRDIAKVTPCQENALNGVQKSRKDKDCNCNSSGCKHRNILAYNKKPNLRGSCTDCQKTKSVSRSGRKRKTRDEKITTQTTSKLGKTDDVILMRDYDNDKERDDIEPVQNVFQSRLPPRQLFADTHSPLSRNEGTIVATFQPKHRAPCIRCSFVTVCGLCFDCNRIENILGNESIISSQRTDYMDTSSMDHLIKHVQSSLRGAIQTKLSKHDGVSSSSLFAPNSPLERSKPRKAKVKFDSSSYKYMEKLWRERDHPYLFGDDLLDQPASFVVGIDASPRRGKSKRFLFQTNSVKIILSHRWFER